MENPCSCVICDETMLTFNRHNLILCPYGKHNVCLNCMGAICMSIKKGQIINFQLFKCPICQQYNNNINSTFIGLDSDGLKIVNIIKKLKCFTAIECNDVYNFIEKIKDITNNDCAVCFKCNTIKIITSKHLCVGSNFESKDLPNWTCGNCSLIYDRVVICSLCKVPVVKIINSGCNHINCINGHYVCAYENCGEAWKTLHYLRRHIVNKNHNVSKVENNLETHQNIEILEEYFLNIDNTKKSKCLIL